jgi:hypothetical protein
MIRSKYWSNSNFANKLRGVNKPPYLSIDEWKKWQKTIKLINPLGNYLASKLNTLQDIIYSPIDLYKSIKGYFYNRFIIKTHVLTSTLKKGEWYDLDQRILYSVFNELKNFVEIECATNYFSLDTLEHLSYNGNSNKGISSLLYTAKLTYEEGEKKGLPLPQAIEAIEVLELYSWWINRSKLPVFEDDSDRYKEDNDMLIRLISIRHFLWT